jgi:FixJ family two-component response regulator
MPEITGVELVKEILAIRTDVPVIMCTGWSMLTRPRRQASRKLLTKREIAKTIRKVLGE